MVKCKNTTLSKPNQQNYRNKCQYTKHSHSPSISCSQRSSSSNRHLRVSRNRLFRNRCIGARSRRERSSCARLDGSRRWCSADRSNSLCGSRESGCGTDRFERGECCGRVGSADEDGALCGDCVRGEVSGGGDVVVVIVEVIPGDGVGVSSENGCCWRKCWSRCDGWCWICDASSSLKTVSFVQSYSKGDHVRPALYLNDIYWVALRSEGHHCSKWPQLEHMRSRLETS